MKNILLLTGSPGSGKTTLIREAIASSPLKAGGFYTRELRAGGRRCGFEIVTLDGATAVLSHVDTKTSHRVGKYYVNVANLEAVGVASLHQALQSSDLIVVDEIGKMELKSEAFKEVVLAAIESGKKVLGTVMLVTHPWADRIKADERVQLVHLSRQEYSRVREEVRRWMSAA